MDGHELDRVLAVDRYRNGESIEAICSSLKKSRSWFYKWLDRSEKPEERWYEERSRRPHHPPSCEGDLRERIVETRGRLQSEGCFVSAQMIAWELESEQVEPPSISTIKRILKGAGLITPRGRVSKGIKYPAPWALDPGAVHQADFVGPRYVSGVRFYSLNAVDVASARAAAEPVISRATEHVIPGLWNIWKRLGIPKALQLDNELVFFGNRRYPRATGQLMRLCLEAGVEMVFIPIREPWRNSFVEKFNDHWNKKFYRRVNLPSFDLLPKEAMRFENRHNSTWRYSKLGGHTPNQALEGSTVALRFPDRPTPPPMPLPKPTQGRVSFIRFIRSNLQLEIFGQRFDMPSEATHEYVRATVDVAAQHMSVSLHGETILSYPYTLG